MSFVPANRSRLLLGSGHLSCFLTQVGQDVTVATEDTTVLCDDAKTYLPTQVDGTLTLQGLFDGSPRAIHDQLSPQKGLHGPLPWTFGPEGLQAGRLVQMAQMVQPSYQVGAAAAGVVQASAGGQVTGVTEEGVALHPPTELVASGQGDPVDQTTATSDGALLHLHVVDVDGTDPTVDVTVQHSVDGTTWTDLHVFDQAETVGYQTQVVAGTVNRHVRAVWTLGGTSPTVKLSAALARR